MRVTLLLLVSTFLVPAHASEKKTRKTKKVECDKLLLQGTWKVIALEYDGKKSKLSDRGLQLNKLSVKGNRWIVRFPPGSDGVTSDVGIFTLASDKKPKRINITGMGDEPETVKGIYSLSGNVLRLCVNIDGTRPSKFATSKKHGCALVVFQREKR